MAERLFERVADGRHGARSAGRQPRARGRIRRWSTRSASSGSTPPTTSRDKLDGRRRLGRRRRRDVRRRVPGRAREALRRLAASRPEGRADRTRARDPRRDRASRARARRRARSTDASQAGRDGAERLRRERPLRPRSGHRSARAGCSRSSRRSTVSCRSGSALAMAAGLGLGTLVPSPERRSRQAPGRHRVSLPIAVGLLLMMYPVLAKVRYEELGHARHDGVSDRLFFGVSLFLSWLVGPALMFALAWLFLPRPARLPDRRDHRRSRALHRDGADLERHREGRPRPGRACSSSSTRSSRSPPTRCSATST